MQRRPRTRLTIITLGVVLICALLVAAGYAWAGSHAVLPGLRGCALMRETAPQSRCVQRQLAGVMRGTSAERGLAAVDRLARDNALVASHCHLAMHPIGERVGTRAARAHDTPPAANGASTCRRGYMHGMMLGFVTHSGTDISRALPKLCARDAQDEVSCSHVVGHLIARTAGTHRAERALVGGCDVRELDADLVTRAKQGRADSAECVRGGYMEIAIEEQQPPLAAWAKRCLASPASTREQCFAWLPPLASYRQLPQADAARMCGELHAPAETRADCVHGVSRLLTGTRACHSFGTARDQRTCDRIRVASKTG